MVTPPRPGPGRDAATGVRRAPAYRPRLRRALALALVGAIGVATPALASGELDDIRDRLSSVEDERQRASADRDSSAEQAHELGEELEHTSAELVAADQRLQETTAQVDQARVVLEEAELDLADAEAETARIEGELALARENEAQIEDSLEQVADDRADTSATVGAIARQSYKQGGMGSLAATLELLSGEADAVDQMSMARTVLRVQDQQIRQLATQEAEQVAEQDRLAGVRSDIAYLLAKAEANVVAKEQARAAADAAKAELEQREAEQEQAKADLESEKAEVEESLAAEEERSQALEQELAELAQTKDGLKEQEQAELERIEEARRQAEAEARRKAEEEARRQAAAEAAAKRAAEEEAARQRAAEREAQRQREAEAEAQRLRDEAAAAEAARRAEAAEAEAAAAAQAAQAAAAREAAERQAAEERASRQAEEERQAAAAASSGILSFPTSGPVTSEFGNRFHPVFQTWRLHAGIDFGPGCGTPVTAAADGVVYTAGFDAGGGNMVIVDHGVLRGVNLTTSYLHLQSAAAVSAGQAVSRGQLIGYVGTTGSSTGCHLHFETRENGTPVNPRTWL
ncbi:M23 family metallopeptidase [uncultured Serinicoccus sp.]|uniref:M23 family metallopeptidase n=1 Tax=uncultured Serinicoccus sp. TaxID=735514 RepID=UPI002610A55B|nr:M23 family metallopeptidase [uncultured Serinicoccus sp.]